MSVKQNLHKEISSIGDIYSTLILLSDEKLRYRLSTLIELVSEICGQLPLEISISACPAVGITNQMYDVIWEMMSSASTKITGIVASSTYDGHMNVQVYDYLGQNYALSIQIQTEAELLGIPLEFVNTIRRLTNVSEANKA